MIVFACSVLMLYEWLAVLTHRPKVSDLSHRWPWTVLVWLWWGLLGLHFLRARHER